MNKWIPVSERLPEYQGKMLGSTKVLITYGDTIQFGYYILGKKWTTTDGFEFTRQELVKAWQPLPEPYKERDEE